MVREIESPNPNMAVRFIGPSVLPQFWCLFVREGPHELRELPDNFIFMRRPFAQRDELHILVGNRQAMQFGSGYRRMRCEGAF